MIYLEGFHDYVEEIKKDRKKTDSLVTIVDNREYYDLYDLNKNDGEEILDREISNIESYIKKYFNIEILNHNNFEIASGSGSDLQIKTMVRFYWARTKGDQLERIIFRKFEDDWWLAYQSYPLANLDYRGVSSEEYYVVDSSEGLEECIVIMNYRSLLT